MRFLQAVPEFQFHHGWKSIAGIAGAIGLSFVPGGAAFAPAVMAAANAWDSADAAKKATKQVQGGYQQGVDVLSPYNARGNAAGDTLAGYLGIQAPPGGFGAPAGAPGAGAGSAELPLYLQPKYVARQQAFLDASNASSSPQALQDFLEIAKRQQENLKTAGKATLNRPQTPSAKGRSSYGPTVMPPIPQPSNVIWN